MLRFERLPSQPNVLFLSGEEKCSNFSSPDRGDCRSRKMMKDAENEYLLAKIGVDTGENEPEV